MSQGALLLTISGAIISSIILYLIISIATKSDKRYRVEYAQLYLTAEIARKQGVSEEKIQEILNWAK